MSREKQRRVLGIVLAIVVAAAAFAYLAFSNVGENLVYYWSPTELLDAGDSACLEIGYTDHILRKLEEALQLRAGALVLRDIVAENDQIALVALDGQMRGEIIRDLLTALRAQQRLP